jgi:8-oxo-dGTP diphosphatase
MKLFVGAKALIVHEGKVLVLREAKYDEGTNEGLWDVPGGRIHPEESLHEGLRREVMEESGLAIEPGQVLNVFETFPTIKGEACHIVRIYYLCTPKTTKVTISTDHDQYEWVDPNDPLDKMEFVSDIRELLALVREKI